MSQKFIVKKAIARKENFAFMMFYYDEKTVKNIPLFILKIRLKSRSFMNIAVLARLNHSYLKVRSNYKFAKYLI